MPAGIKSDPPPSPSPHPIKPACSSSKPKAWGSPQLRRAIAARWPPAAAPSSHAGHLLPRPRSQGRARAGWRERRGHRLPGQRSYIMLQTRRERSAGRRRGHPLPPPLASEKRGEKNTQEGSPRGGESSPRLESKRRPPSSHPKRCRSSRADYAFSASPRSFSKALLWIFFGFSRPTFKSVETAAGAQRRAKNPGHREEKTAPFPPLFPSTRAFFLPFAAS